MRNVTQEIPRDAFVALVAALCLRPAETGHEDAEAARAKATAEALARALGYSDAPAAPQTRSGDAETDLQRADTRIDELSGMLSEARDGLEAAQRENVTLRAHADQLQAQISELQAKLDAATPVAGDAPKA